jgi:hypothetical protein
LQTDALLPTAVAFTPSAGMPRVLDGSDERTDLTLKFSQRRSEVI